LTYSHSTGAKDVNSIINHAKEALNGLFERLDTLCTLSEGDARRIWKEAAQNYDAIIVGGGDGTFSLAIDAIMRCDKKPALGYLPLGTLGDAARNLRGALKIRKNPQKAIGLEINEIDVPRITTEHGDRYFLYSATFGTYSDVAYLATRKFKKKWGRWSYYFLSLKEAFKSQYVLGLWKTDHNAFMPVKTPFVLCLNGEFMGGFKINGGSRLDDGRMELYLPKRRFMGGLLEFLPFKTIKPISFSAAEFHIDAGEAWCVDGEKMPGKSAEIELFPHAIRYLAFH